MVFYGDLCKCSDARMKHAAVLLLYGERNIFMRLSCGKIVVSLLLFFLSAAAWSFSFDANLDFSVQGEKYTSKIYYAGDKLRQNVTNKEGEEEILIIREDLKKIWYLDKNLKIYRERPMELNIAATIGIFDVIKAKSHETFLGNEKLDGMDVKKYLVKVDSTDRDIRFYAWKKTGQQVPVKVVDVKGIARFEYSNVNYRDQDKALFELPPGIVKVE